MIRCIRLFFALGFATAYGSAFAQEPRLSPDNIAAIPRAELEAITARGLLLVEYDAAARHARDAIRALAPPTGVSERYVARKLEDGRWEVAFGRLTAKADTYHVALRTIQVASGAPEVTTYEMRPPSADVGYHLRAARALELCRRDFFRVPARPYNAMVVPTGAREEFYVYFVIAPTVPGVWPHGADVRYRVSADGRTIRERRQLHHTVMEYAVTVPRAEMTATIHFAQLHDRPEDTDVYHVLTRQPPAPALVVSRSYFFAIDLAGQIMAYNRDTTTRR